ncbi:MAG: cytochrome d ubiquinol oxidase subunit II [Candidatus Latescibacterota bacterium]
MEATALQIIWFLLFGVLIIGYAILDGFDLGVGVLSLFGKKGRERRLYLNAIGPVWDGNEVWLLTAGGALFAAFPPVYATVFSGFYLALMLLLAALIFRAVSMEFRSKVDSPRWQSFWDWSFGLGSLVPALLFGVAVGNILRGIPLNAQGDFTGSFIGLLNPYSLLIGILSLVMFTCHGALYMALKTDGDLRERMLGAAPKLWITWIACYILATILSLFVSPWLFEGLLPNPLFWILFLALLASLLFIPIAIRGDKPLAALIASSVAIGTMTGLAGLSLFPYLVPSLSDLSYSLTVANASSTPRTLTTMLVIALLGMPIVIGYTIYIYRVFKGKVEITDESY